MSSLERGFDDVFLNAAAARGLSVNRLLSVAIALALAGMTMLVSGSIFAQSSVPSL